MGADDPVAAGITGQVVRELGRLRFLAATRQLSATEMQAIMERAMRDPTPRAQAEALAIRDELAGRPRHQSPA
jgi:hypothetical protein